jgi:hypothetical protein
MSNVVRGRYLSVPVCALLVVLGVSFVTSAGASTPQLYFGSSLDHSPANAGNTCAQDGVQGGGLKCTHVGSYYPGFSGHPKAPANGTVTAIKLRAEGPATLHILIVAVRNVSSDHKSGQAKVVLNGPTLHPVGTGGVEQFPVHLVVKKGQELAVNTTSNTAEYCSDGTPGQLLFDPPLGTSFTNSNGVDGCLMLVQAVMKAS